MRRSRRDFLRTVGAGSLALSLFDARNVRAQNQPLPKRLVLVFTPNGTIPDAWGADGTKTDFKLRRILAPLAPYQRYLNVMQGVDQLSAYSGPGDGHQQGMGHLWTGVELLPGDIKGGCESCPAASFASGLSIDQAVANKIGTDRAFKSLELGIMVNGGENTWNRMCYRGSGQPLPPESDPTKVFQRVFGKLGEDPFGVAQRRALRKSVLDFVHQDFAALRPALAAEDRQKLDQHETTLREIEQRLDNPGTVGTTCKAPGAPQTLDARAVANVPAIAKLQTDMLVTALACDLTRVASLQWTNSVGQMSFPWLGISDRQHDLSHEGDGNADAKEKLIKMNTWYATQLAYLLERLASVPEGDGTMLDNTLVVWGNELGKGNSHTRHDIPFLLAGKAGGALRTGQLLPFGNRSHSDLLLTIGRAMGLTLDKFGDARWNTGVIADLLA
ncbi:MAG: DUF1552 domain-containing protein [Polyangiales bacterium]